MRAPRFAAATNSELYTHLVSNPFWGGTSKCRWWPRWKARGGGAGIGKPPPKAPGAPRAPLPPAPASIAYGPGRRASAVLAKAHAPAALGPRPAVAAAPPPGPATLSHDDAPRLQPMPGTPAGGAAAPRILPGSFLARPPPRTRGSRAPTAPPESPGARFWAGTAVGPRYARSPSRPRQQRRRRSPCVSGAQRSGRDPRAMRGAAARPCAPRPRPQSLRAPGETLGVCIVFDGDLRGPGGVEAPRGPGRGLGLQAHASASYGPDRRAARAAVRGGRGLSRTHACLPGARAARRSEAAGSGAPSARSPLSSPVSRPPSHPGSRLRVKQKDLVPSPLRETGTAGPALRPARSPRAETGPGLWGRRAPHLRGPERACRALPSSTAPPPATRTPGAAARGPEVPPAGVRWKAPATASGGRVPARRTAHGPSPGGTERAGRGARRVCGSGALSDAPPPHPSPAHGQEPGLR